MELQEIYQEALEDDFGRKEIRIIVGPRQVGKTTILKKIAKRYSLRKTICQYYNLEIPQDARYFARPVEAVLKDLTAKKQIIFIDEFHYLPNATKLFKAIFDGFPSIGLYASGSSAIECTSI